MIIGMCYFCKEPICRCPSCKQIEGTYEACIECLNKVKRMHERLNSGEDRHIKRPKVEAVPLSRSV